ncbi:hypothetical protein ACFY3N_31915 [Streptomyces sp. NPDC000348]|uniref:hypothetical protein n=1 Tax=Streptomyces sp. NPDC000348 TaxID=3364538 RepID=UPI0036BDA6DF
MCQQTTDSEVWERTAHRRRVVPLDDPDLLMDGVGPAPDMADHERVNRVLNKLAPAEHEVADCYATTGRAWEQAVLASGQPAPTGERVRRKLKRLGAGYQRRRQPQTDGS